MDDLWIGGDPLGCDHFIVEGLLHDDPDSDRDFDGEHAPFMIFLPGLQDYLPCHFETRAEAQEVADKLNPAALRWRETR